MARQLLRIAAAMIVSLIFVFDLSDLLTIPKFSLPSTGTLFLAVNLLIFCIMLNGGYFTTISNALVVYEGNAVTSTFRFPSKEPPELESHDDRLALSVCESPIEQDPSPPFSTLVRAKIDLPIYKEECRAIVPATLLVGESEVSPPVTPRTKMKRKKKGRKGSPSSSNLSSPNMTNNNNNQQLAFDIDQLSLDDFNDKISFMIRQRRQEWQLR